MDTSKFESFDNKSFQRFTNPANIRKDLQTLIGIINGVKSDRVINDKEYQELHSWIATIRQYENKQPYKEIIGLVREALVDKILTEDESQNIIWFCNQYIRENGYYDVIKSGIQQLTGIVKGITFDNEINIDELNYLDVWLEENDYLKNSWPYDELYTLITKILKDRKVTEEEHNELLAFCKAISGDTNESTSTLITTLQAGFCQIDPTINIEGSTFCITGVSKKYKRREIAEKIELYGGFVVDNISSKINYLIVCDEKNTCWAFTCYGRKIEEAIKLRKQSIPLVIVHEVDLYDAWQSLPS